MIILQIVAQGTCCLSNNNFSTIHDSCFYKPSLPKLYNWHIKAYCRDDHIKISYDNFIHGALIKSFCHQADVTNTPMQTIQRYDINSAYMSTFTRNMILPTAEVMFNKVGHAAHKAFLEIPNETNNFYFIKVKLLGYAKMNHVQRLYVGKHTTHIHGFIADIRYLQFLNIEFKVCHIVCCKGAVNTQFQCFCKKLIALKSKSNMYSSICKAVGLFGLGIDITLI